MKEKKLPTILGLILLILILVAGVYLSLKPTTLSSDASVSCEPTNPQITNLTYSSFDFSFTTSKSCTATFSLNNKIYQDSSAAPNTHYFKITNLSPQTQYQFSLISGGATYARPEFRLTTAIKPTSSIPASNLAWGKILTASGTPVSGAIVYLTLPGSQPLSAFSNKDGHWNISLAVSFNESKTNWFSPTATDSEDIIVYSPDGQLTQLSNSVSNNDPVPDIIVGQNNFSSLSTNSSSGQIPTQTTLSNSTSISITSPTEAETITSLRPDIFGNGPSGQSLQLNLDGNSASVTPSANNIWHWSPSTDLSSGSHYLSLTYQGKTVSRSFSVQKDNNILSFSATPSATIITPSPKPTTLVLSPTPTIKSSPTSTPVISTPRPSTSSTLYQTGTTFPTYFLVLSAIIIFGVSLFYYRR